MFRQRQFLLLMGPEERGFQRIQRGSDRLESFINGLSAGRGGEAGSAAGRRCGCPTMARQPPGSAARAPPGHGSQPASLPSSPRAWNGAVTPPGSSASSEGPGSTQDLLSLCSLCRTPRFHPDSQTHPMVGLAPGLAVVSGEEPGASSPWL